VPAPAASATKPGTGTGAAVRVGEHRVFEVQRERAGVSAEKRALEATRVLQAAAEEAEEPEIRVELKGDVAVLYAGKSPVIQLEFDDAQAAGDSSLSVHAATLAGKTREALQTERRRHAAAQSVFSISLVVFSALIAFLLVRKIGELADKARDWLAAHPESVPHLRVQGIDVISPRALSGGLTLALGAGRLLGQIGIVYAWVIVSLSMFDATRSYTTQLTKAVITPLTGLAQRVAGSVPLIIVTAITLFALMLLLRFVGLFFQNLARGSTTVGWLSQDLASATGVLVRGGVIVGALVLGIPLVTGTDEGALGRAGVVALAALALAATPILATGSVGVLIVFGRRVRPGDVVEVAGRSGRVTGIDLLETRVEDDEGCEVRVPHLLTLLHPTTVLGHTGLARVELSVAARADHAEVRKLLHDTAASLGQGARVELLSFGASGARYAVSIRTSRQDGRSELLTELAGALLKARVPLGGAASGEAGEAGGQSSGRAGA
jgi:small-conductance mechanosensitive channel